VIWLRDRTSPLTGLVGGRFLGSTPPSSYTVPFIVGDLAMGWWGLCGLLIAGAGDRVSHLPWETDYSSSAPSRVTHVAQCVVFGAVMADAAMLDAALGME
jgi:hypothetical protein